jgi:tripartite-type tricarboxylate transporter receptor subunit TctC
MNRRNAVLAGLAVGLPYSESAVGQQDCCPGKCCPSTFIVPFPPGGGVDFAARVLAQGLSKLWGQNVIVENVGGRGGLIGATRAASAAPDGKTLLFTNESISMNAALVPLQGQAALDSLAPISQVTSVPYVLVVPSQSPYKSLQELVSAAQREPGKLTMASAGIGSTSHLSGATFAASAKIAVSHVPYKGTGPAVTDLLGGQVAFAVLDLPSALPHVRQGKLRPLAVSGSARHAFLSDVPTFAQAGVQGFEITSWTGLFAPKALQEQTLRRVAQEVAGVLQESDVRERLANSGAQVAPLATNAFASKIAADFQARNATIASQRIPRE